MVRPPRLYAVGGHRKPGRQFIQFLKNEIDLDLTSETFRREHLPELLFEQVTDHENHAAESGADGIVDRIVDNSLSARPHAVHLFQRTVPGSHSRSQNQKCRFYHVFVVFLNLRFGRGRIVPHRKYRRPGSENRTESGYPRPNATQIYTL